MKIIENGIEREMTEEEISSAGFEPAPLPESPITIVFPTDLWRRMTDGEVSQVEAQIGTQPSRVQRIFNAATEYRSDDELWPLLVGIANSLFGPERAEEILAASR